MAVFCHILLSHSPDPSKQVYLPFSEHGKISSHPFAQIVLLVVPLSPQLASLNLVLSAAQFKTPNSQIPPPHIWFLSPLHSSSISSVSHVDFYPVALHDIIFYLDI